LSAWRGANRGLDGVALASTAGQVSVSGVHRRPGAGGPAGEPAGEPAGDPIIEASFTNAGQAPSSPFVPLLVISDAGGLELAETAGAAQTLAPGARVTVALPARLGKLPHGTYFVSVIPSHPDSGRSTGIGQYHVEMKL
jgi:hypothetical protein